MDGFERIDEQGVRMSDSPGRSPRVNHGLTSPVRSVHPDVVMELLNSQADFGHRTADFFDDTSESDAASAPLVKPPHNRPLHEQHTMTARAKKTGNYLGGTVDQFKSQCEEKRASSPTAAIDAYLRLAPGDPHEPPPLFSQSADSSYVESVDEMTPSRARHGAARGLRHTFKRQSRSPRSSMLLSGRDDESPILPRRNEANETILDAHKLTLQALLRQQETLEIGAHSATPPNVERTSKFILSQSIRDSQLRSNPAPTKKVSLAPPPINTTAIRLSSPTHIIHTPYPFAQIHRKDFGRSPMSASTSGPAKQTDSLLTLSIRRSNPQSRPRVTTLFLPAPHEFSFAQSNPIIEKERHFRDLDFDDAALFTALRASYAALLGPFRLLSARTLVRITVSGAASRAADARYGWLHSPVPVPGSTQRAAARGPTDTFSDDKLLLHFRRPKRGEARYAWVSWAHRLAEAGAGAGAGAAAPLLTPGLAPAMIAAQSPDSGAGSDGGSASRRQYRRRRSRSGCRDSLIPLGPEGLEFVVAWSAARILLVLASVLLLSIAAALLWIFLGKSSNAGGALAFAGEPNRLGSVGASGAGFRGAGDRVGAGMLLGICVLLIGLVGMSGWLWISWLVL